MYEVITTITTIYPHPGLIQTAAKSITRFLTSTNSNLKYLGITALAAIVKVDPAHAGPHQMVVIDCLEHPDETIKRKVIFFFYFRKKRRQLKWVIPSFRRLTCCTR